MKAFQTTVKEFFGENPEESQSYGRIVNHRQFDRLQRILESTDRNKVVVGGRAEREKLFISPTVISPVTVDDANLMQDEIFGMYNMIRETNSYTGNIRHIRR